MQGSDKLSENGVTFGEANNAGLDPSSTIILSKIEATLRQSPKLGRLKNMTEKCLTAENALAYFAKTLTVT